MAHLRNIADIRQNLTQKAMEKLVHALVTSRLDNNNAVLYGLPGILLDGIQGVQILQRVASVIEMSPVLPF